ncbi:hypothetical protein HFK74_12945|uniref:hypothetical protein n=1 Tax=Pseudomonas sp. SbOxS1 TaxID=2723884 RepID=UPI0015D2C611|nr:hypothetical protein [Pseudomonas sp. SbOxS1]NYU03605.1 hypothetical protein [Pseudomonas sp. SbOxS1]
MIVSKQARGGYGFQITRFTAHNPTRLSKRFLLADNDELIKESGGVLIEGEAERLCLTGIAEFAQLLTDLTPNRALSYGINDHDFARVVTKGKVEAAAKDSPLPVIARDRKHMRWPEGAGILLGDYDPADDGDSLSPDALLSLLYSVCPAIATAPHLHRPSSGSCIVNVDTLEVLRGVQGQRVYIVVKDANDLARAGQNLYDRLWLAGKGRIQISASGGMLLRAPIDASVFQPERLDFAGGAECIAPLAQKLPKPLVMNPDAAPLDTAVSLPDLTKTEQAQILLLQTDAKAACAADAAAVRAQWMNGRLKELVKQHPDTPKARLREVLKQAAEGGVLGPEFILYTSDMQPVTVAELLAAPEQWHGRYLRDPLEPEYGSSTAWVNLKGAPYIYSHAHGLNARYELSLARAAIELKAGELPKIVDSAIQVMREDGLLFEHGGELVRLVNDGVEPVDAEWLRIYLGRLIRFTKYDKRQKATVVVDCPVDLPRLVLAQHGAWDLPVLRGVISAPILRPDGSILETKGFDRDTGLYLDRQAEVHIEARPSKAAVALALGRLWKPFEKFPFVSAVDRGVMLAALFTACQRPILPTAPGFGFDAPTAGSGKTLLTKCLALIAGVSDPVMMPPVTQEDELRKRLLSALRRGKGALVLDNQVGMLDSPSLCTFLTSPVYGDRVLGQSAVLDFPNTALFIINGNNFQPMGDLARRVLTSRLDAQMERPDKRSFGLDPAAWVRANRQEMVRDALTVLRGYQLDLIGSRRGAGRMASFEAWDDAVRQAVLWGGSLGVIELGDPLDAIDTAYGQDPDRAKLAALLHGWYEIYGDKPTKVATVIDGTKVPWSAFTQQGTTNENEDARVGLRAALEEIAGEGHVINPRLLGRWIEKHAGCVVGGLRFRRGKNLNGTATWSVSQI